MIHLQINASRLIIEKSDISKMNDADLHNIVFDNLKVEDIPSIHDVILNIFGSSISSKTFLCFANTILYYVKNKHNLSNYIVLGSDTAPFSLLCDNKRYNFYKIRFDDLYLLTNSGFNYLTEMKYKKPEELEYLLQKLPKKGTEIEELIHIKIIDKYDLPF